ncbi:MAG: hypothetical protein AB8B80_11665 [Marinicellaceae bacterium]
MKNECDFFIEIDAPDGLAGIEEYIGKCRLPLTPYLSRYNNKVILKCDGENSRVEWNMDSSDNEIMIASGTFFIPVDEAWQLLSGLSLTLTSSGFPHKIGIDDEEGSKTYSCSYLWNR